MSSSIQIHNETPVMHASSSTCAAAFVLSTVNASSKNNNSQCTVSQVQCQSLAALVPVALACVLPPADWVRHQHSCHPRSVHRAPAVPALTLLITQSQACSQPAAAWDRQQQPRLVHPPSAGSACLAPHQAVAGLPLTCICMGTAAGTFGPLSARFAYTVHTHHAIAGLLSPCVCT